jgi:hypothetical protein
MVTVELRAQHVERDDVEWETIAVLRANGRQVEVTGDAGRLDRSLPVISLTSGRRLRYEDDPEEWARSLPTVYHAPDFLAIVVEDSDPPASPFIERQQVIVADATPPQAASE